MSKDIIPDMETPPSQLTPKQRLWLRDSRSLYLAFYCARWEQEIRRGDGAVAPIQSQTSNGSPITI